MRNWPWEHPERDFELTRLFDDKQIADQVHGVGQQMQGTSQQPSEGYLDSH